MLWFRIAKLDRERGFAWAERAGDPAHYFLHGADADFAIELARPDDWFRAEVVETKRGPRLVRARQA